MALYAISDVILDSYPAGGCTTTREALEVGGVVVTLPAQYLGSRWSVAYYSIMGVMDLVATSFAEYTEMAVRMGTDGAARAEVRTKIKANIHKLFRQTAAVESWTKVLTEIAPPCVGPTAPLLAVGADALTSSPTVAHTEL
jgi:predicted O-linked N-acetylglucosamine transferase (SPINDLY family)